MGNKLPTPPKLSQIIGPSFVLLGLALGSGELIMWPYLTSQYGMGLVWGAVLGISFQFLLNTEVMRYTLCWGESVFVGFWRLSRFFPIWFIFSTFIPWSLPGFSSGVAEILAHTLGLESSLWLAILFLVLTGVVLTIGKTLYRTMEFIQKTIILAGLPFILFLVLVFTGKNDLVFLAKGLVGRGEGWWFFPAGIVWASFLGAVAYSGAGGNLNLAQSYYIKEKGFGMGKFTAKISSLLISKSKTDLLTGKTFIASPKEQKKFFSWWQLVLKEHLIVFWGLGLLTIILLSLLSYVLVYGSGQSSGIDFLYGQSSMITGRIGSGFGLLFLLTAAGMLYSTQVGVLESTSRIISENVLLLRYKKGRKVNLSLYFYLALWLQIFWGVVILLLGFTEPRFLLTLGAVLNAGAMAVAFPLVWFLNKKRLPGFARAKKTRVVFYFIGFAFLLIFLLIVLRSVI